MFIGMFVRMFTHGEKPLYDHTDVEGHTCTHARTYTYTHVYICMHIDVFVYVYMYVCVWEEASIRSHQCRGPRWSTHKSMRTHTHAYTHTRTYTCTRVYVCT